MPACIWEQKKAEDFTFPKWTCSRNLGYMLHAGCAAALQFKIAARSLLCAAKSHLWWHLWLSLLLGSRIKEPEEPSLLPNSDSAFNRIDDLVVIVIIVTNLTTVLFYLAYDVSPTVFDSCTGCDWCRKVNLCQSSLWQKGSKDRAFG